MRTVELAPEKQNNEVSIRRVRCLTSPKSPYQRRLPSLSLAGVWLKEAGFDVGNFTRIVVLDGMLVISCEKIPENRDEENSD